jgi:uncharacterized protein YgbK (DUF1537 family)
MIGVIADDLTGAAELGAVGWRYGLRAEVIVSGDPGTGPDLICIDTDSRSCCREESAKRAASAAAKLRQAGAKWIYKKVDSVLRGQVIAEVEAIMRQLDVSRALLAPANPSLGRTIRDETYFIHGRPIHETEFAHDPEYPRKSSRVLEMLSAPGSVSISISRPECATTRAGIVVAEVDSPADLRLWVGRKTSDTLPAGGAEFFGALLAAEGHAAKPGRRPASPVERELFLCGTVSESSREFTRVARVRGTPVFSLPDELARRPEFPATEEKRIAQETIESFRSHQRVILNVGLPLISDRAIARSLTGHLVRIAQLVIRNSNPDHIYVEGGATAAALLRKMNWHHCEVVEELAQGVATLAIAGDNAVKVTIKPGSYMWPAELREREFRGPRHSH